MRLALDTNILAYAEGVNGPVRQQAAADLIDKLTAAEIVIPVQVLGELMNVLVRKAHRASAKVRDSLLSWRNGYELAPTGIDSLLRAVDVIDTHKLAAWDAIILVVAAEAQCDLLLSEDFQDGFTWGGVTVANPFATRPHPLLVSVLGRGT